jgi:predicted ester cyclase
MLPASSKMALHEIETENNQSGDFATNRKETFSMSITETAREFFEACETGRGWAECAQYCHDGATFSCQADALAEISALEGYTDWMRDLLTPIPDGSYELKSFSTDDERAVVTSFHLFNRTQTRPRPLDPPTGKSVTADYVYAMEFDGDRIRHMTKIWNDVQSLRELGWA